MARPGAEGSISTCDAEEELGAGRLAPLPYVHAREGVCVVFIGREGSNGGRDACTFLKSAYLGFKTKGLAPSVAVFILLGILVAEELKKVRLRLFREG